MRCGGFRPFADEESINHAGKKFINFVRLCSHLAKVKETDMIIFGNNSLTIGLKHLQDIIANLAEGLKTN